MNIKERVTKIIEVYKNSIKPLIQNEQYELAFMEMNNLCFLINNHEEEIATKVHCGISFLASAKLLRDNLKMRKDIDMFAEEFEAYSAQTRLLCKE